jgi:hypothetical protein
VIDDADKPAERAHDRVVSTASSTAEHRTEFEPLRWEPAQRQLERLDVLKATWARSRLWDEAPLPRQLRVADATTRF